MRSFTLLIGGFLLWGTVSCGESLAQTAKAELRNVEGEIVGSASLVEAEGGVKITLEVSKLPPGLHAFHVHGFGKCEPPDFASAGPHFNPHGRKHGQKNPEGAHAGDLPTLEVGPDGTGQFEILATEVTLGEGPHSLFQPDGTAIMIHASPDDDVTDPAGNAGARVACGVIQS